MISAPTVTKSSVDPPAGRKTPAFTFLHLLNQMRDAFFLFDSSGQVIEVSDSALALYGYSRDEMLALKALELQAPEAREDFAQQGPEVMSSDGLLFESVHQRHDGSRFPVEVSIRGFYIEGSPLRLSLVRDISGRKNTEEQLRASLGSPAEAKCISRMGRWNWNLVTDRINWSPELYAIFGLTPPADGQPGSIRDLVHPDDLVDFDLHMAAYARREGLIPFQYRIKRPDGEVRRLVHDGILKYDATGRPSQIVGTVFDITERRKEDQEGRQSEERFQTIFRDAPIGIMLLDPISGQILEANTSAARILGRSSEELSGLTWATITPPEDIPTQAEVVTRLNAGLIPNFRMEKRYLRPDGSILWTNLTVTTLHLGSEAPPRSLAMLEDITERRAAEEALRESEFFFRESQRVGSIGSYRANFSADNWTASEVLYGIFGIDENYPRTLASWSELIHPDDREMTNRYLYEEVIGKKLPFAREYRIVRSSDGEIRWVSGLGEVLCDSEGSVIGLTGTIQDITERKRAEAEQAERTRLIDLAHDAIIILDPDRRIRYWSQGAENTYGYTSEEARGQIAYELLQTVFPISRVAVDETLEKVGKWRGQLEHTTRDGRKVTIESRQSTERNSDGRIRAILEINRDISEQKASETRLRQSAMVFESSEEGIALTDLSGRILTVNPAFTTITGYSEAEVAGHNPSLLSSGRQNPDFYRQLWAAVLAEGTWRGEIWNRRKNGEIYPEWLSINTVRDEQGQPTNYVGTFTDTSRIKAAQQEIDFLGHHDVLTGLPNRLLFNEQVGAALRAAEAGADLTGVFILNIDHFGKVNDGLGHTIGDGLLQAVAARLAMGDPLARIGGDEFGILVSGLNSPHDIAVRAQAYLDHLVEPFEVEGVEVIVTCSIGVSLAPLDGRDPAALLGRAGIALRQAKLSGPGSIAFADDAVATDLEARVRTERLLRRVVARGELRLHYQPQVNLLDRSLVGVEALVRWQHPERGLVSPSEFIPLAEEIGIIEEIGEWVLAEAGRQMAEWQQAGVSVPRVAVNISAPQLDRNDLASVVGRILHSAGLSSECLELEVTESMIMHHTKTAARALAGLRELGVELAMDDFGTGYSSLAELRRLPLRRLKIDMSFVQDIADPAAQAIIQAIIAMARSLGLQTVAEGVEREDQAAFLLGAGCDIGQGYLFSRPVPAEELRVEGLWM